jgi:glycosyltransferase involved in cell wall biosynthesis
VRITTALTVYNATWCVERAIQSVLDQTEPVHEILVADDGSTDGTPELVESRFGDRVRLLRLPHRNASATRKTAIAQATGDWIAFLDADDWWAPEKIERQRRFLERHPEVRWMSTDGRYVSERGVLRESWLDVYFEPVRDLVGDLLPLLVERCFPLMSSSLCAREAYEAVGGLDPDIVYSHDYDLWVRLAARYPGGVLAERLVDYWTGPGTLSRFFEARYRDDLGIMRRIEANPALSADVRRRAARRAAGIEFDIALVALRSGRLVEARERLRAASRHGPLSRRALAAVGAWMPPAAMGPVSRSGWLKERVQEARMKPVRIHLTVGSESGG